MNNESLNWNGSGAVLELFRSVFIVNVLSFVKRLSIDTWFIIFIKPMNNISCVFYNEKNTRDNL